MKLNFTEDALGDLDAIHDWIALDDPEAAKRTIARIIQSAVVLETLPLAGRPGRLDDTREWSVGRMPFFVVYRIVSETEIDILAIVHTRMQWPPDSA